MKLNAARVQKTLDQYDARAIPEDHPAMPELNGVFGEHTFFLDGNGLAVVEPAEPKSGGAETGKVVRLASWKDANRTSLAPHPPEATDIVVELEAEGGAKSA
jgi:hypothetical protein